MTDRILSSTVSRIEYPHNLPSNEVADVLGTDLLRGLSSEEAEHPIGTDGPNELQKWQAQAFGTLSLLSSTTSSYSFF